MELKEFIKTVLIDICEAVDEAKREVNSCAIAPNTMDGVLVEKGQPVSFEISVKVSDASKGEKKGKIQVLSLGASAGTESNKEKQHINKISFEVPIFYSVKFTDKESL